MLLFGGWCGGLCGVKDCAGSIEATAVVIMHFLLVGKDKYPYTLHI